MPVTFGAVGDIISLGLLAKDLLATLDEARGSKAEYRAAVQAIKTLNDTINIVNQHVIQQGLTTPELHILCEASRQAVAKCGSLGDALLERIRRYRATFDGNFRANKLKEVTMAVRWRIGEKEALERFHAEILGASLSLQTLLATANFTLLRVNRKEVNEKLDEAQLRNHDTVRSHDATLNDIKHGIKHANINIEAGNSILVKVSEALKFDWIRQLGSELKRLMQGVMAVNFATYRAVIRLQTALPSHLERGLFEEPVILDDPIGRITPVHLQFVTSWDAFHSILDVRFQNVPGHSKMRQRKYALQVRGTKKEIEQSRPWQYAFLPGQRVEMSFIFDDRSTGDTCPGCHTPSASSVGAELRCNSCQLLFRRIQEVPDNSNRDETLVEQDDSGRTNHKRPRPYDLAYDEDITNFKRVRLVKSQARVERKIVRLAVGHGMHRGSTVSSTTDQSGNSQSTRDSRAPGMAPKYIAIESPRFQQRTRPAQEDWVLVREMDPNHPDTPIWQANRLQTLPPTLRQSLNETAFFATTKYSST